jgi:hypothetical protein
MNASQSIWMRILGVFFVLDIGAAVALLFAVHGWKLDPSIIISHCVWHFQTDTVDLAILSVFRVVVSIVLTWLGVKYGTAETLRERALKDQLAVVESGSLSKSINDEQSMDYRLLGAVDNGASAADEEEQTKLDFAGLTQSQLEEQIALVRNARARRRVVFVLLFAWLQGQSFFSGVKLVDFTFSMRASQTWQVALMGALIAIINIEHLLIQHFVVKMTDPAGLKMPSLHHHTLHFDDSVAGHWYS